MRDSALKPFLALGAALAFLVGNELMRDSALKPERATADDLVAVELEMSSCATAL